MSRQNALPPSSGFLWAFVLNRGSPVKSHRTRRPVKGTPSISIVIPTLNEAENLKYVLPHIPDWVTEVVLVDGFSTDDTVAVATALRPDIRIVMQQGRGKGAALRTGFKAARGDMIVMMDADASTDPRELPAFVGALLSGADLVKGSRFIQGAGTSDMGFQRRFGNWVFVSLVRLLFGGCYSDLCYGYMAFWRDILPQLKLDCDGFEIETLISVRALREKLRVMEVPSFEENRVHGVSHLRAIPDGWRVLKTIFSEKFRSKRVPVIRPVRRPGLGGMARTFVETEPLSLVTGNCELITGAGRK